MRTPLAIRLPEAMVSQIDAIAAERLDQPDRSTVIRELLVEALEARMVRGKRR
jgi:metal-responsive CopG/Arc/MetJ family transcriptional regulator